MNIRELPLIGSSYNFAGDDNGGVSVSIFFVQAEPGRGAPLHRHEYDEVIVVEEGRSRLVVGDEVYEAGKGDLHVIKAGTPHGFVNVGDGVLRQMDIHTNPRFRQENLPSTETSRNAGIPE